MCLIKFKPKSKLYQNNINNMKSGSFHTPQNKGEIKMDKFKTHEIIFTTSQTSTIDPADLEKFWYDNWSITNFGQSYYCEVIPYNNEDSDGQLVLHKVFKHFDHDPRKKDAGIVHDEIDDWIAEVNDNSPYNFIEVDELLSMNPSIDKELVGS